MNKIRFYSSFFLLAIFAFPFAYQAFHTFSHHGHELFDLSQHQEKNTDFSSKQIHNDNHCLILEFDFLINDIPTESIFEFILNSTPIFLENEITSLIPNPDSRFYSSRAPPLS